jgi:hypothetical protein
MLIALQHLYTNNSLTVRAVKPQQIKKQQTYHINLMLNESETI